MPVTDIWRIRFDRLRGEMKPPSVFQLKKAQISAIGDQQRQHLVLREKLFERHAVIV